ncbi:ROK family transcriptional regulator [Alteribacillus bidgolensis]|uniref:Sugar kinase of the NBD/HSP70 family, may contain an N-terminal HTH domain n=1 Tax=Alteribacillus bidgolensis TaxID=930129 RepID=A0A1G8QVE5_9BACI|nr:ROK family transcriptional regulator [Alteribacillus bidgolensis]SDJ08613.1 Sugar kinase of the NBD/HSP70 family, may contain an N-terminal HTH domain [Alteribacillus bidgolensis]
MLQKLLSSTTQKGINLKALYNCVRNEPELTKAEIAQSTGLKLSTCARLLEELIEQGLLYESGEAESSGGRKPKKYSIQPDVNYLVGIDISRTFSKVVLMGLDLKIIAEERFDMNDSSTPDVMIEQFTQVIHSMLDRNNIPDASLLGIGVSAIGPLDTKQGVIKNPLHFPAPKWEDVPIKEMLKKHFDTNIELDYGENTALDAERRLGAARDDKNVIYINKGAGIRLAIMLNREILRSTGGDKVGAFGQGHMVVDIHGKKCVCGNYGCMNTYSTIPALLTEAKSRLKRGHSSILSETVDDFSTLTFLQLVSALKQGDDFSEQVVKDVAYYSAAGLANMVIIFHPSIIILSGPMYREMKLYYQTVVEMTEARYKKLFPQLNVAFSQGELGENAAAIGAGSLVLDSLLSF